MFFCVFLCFSTFSYVFLRFSALFCVFLCLLIVVSLFFCVFLRFSMFRQYPGSGSFGGRVWGARCIFFVYSSTTIWALFAKQQGHQIASTIATCTRTDEEPCIPGPLCSCTDTALFGTLLPAGSSDFGGAPRANCLSKLPRSHRHTRWPNLAEFGDDANFRSDPTFTRASPGLRS